MKLEEALRRVNDAFEPKGFWRFVGLSLDGRPTFQNFKTGDLLFGGPVVAEVRLLDA